MSAEPTSAPLPDALEIAPLNRPPAAVVSVPGSKSITNRALVLAALASRNRWFKLVNVLRSEGTEVMRAALERLGFRPGIDWAESTVTFPARWGGALIPATAADLFVANSGTTMRFLTAMLSLGQGRYRLDGVPRMRQRPVGDLLEALGQLGVRATGEAGNGCPPVVIETGGWRGSAARARGHITTPV